MGKNKRNKSKRKRSANSTSTSISDFDITLNTSETEVISEELTTETENKKQDKTEKQKVKKAKTMDGHTCTSIDTKLEEINKKLNNVLTKQDRAFIKDIIKDSIEEMKTQLLGTVIKRIEILEGDLHDKMVENDKMKKAIETQKETIESMKKENVSIQEDLTTKTETINEDLNNLQQYSRRNNVRITGIDGDEEKQSSAATTALVVTKLNEHLKLNITSDKIDISHRVGTYKQGNQRPILVKFVHRETKGNIMRIAKTLKGTNIYINEDLTHLNQEVLSSIRRNAKDKIDHSWSFEGKIYIRYQDKYKFYTNVVPYKRYGYWLAYVAPPITKSYKAVKTK